MKSKVSNALFGVETTNKTNGNFDNKHCRPVLVIVCPLYVHTELLISTQLDVFLYKQLSGKLTHRPMSWALFISLLSNVDK